MKHFFRHLQHQLQQVPHLRHWVLSKFTFILSEDISFSWILLAQLLLLGLIFGVVGGLFAWCLKLVKRFLSDKIKNPIVRIALVGVGLSALFLLYYIKVATPVWEPI